MSREITEITLDEDGNEQHESWITVAASQVQSTGCRLFDSEITHRHYITVRVCRCSRSRDLNHDWIHSERQLMEFAMSQAQWGAFVSSFGQGNGVPATLFYDHDGPVAQAPYESRLRESAREVRNAGDKATAEIAGAYAELETAFERGAGKREMRDLMRTLKYRVQNAPSGMEFAADSLSKHVENVVTKARADVEAMAVAAGMPALDAVSLRMLEPGDS